MKTNAIAIAIILLSPLAYGEEDPYSTASLLSYCKNLYDKTGMDALIKNNSSLTYHNLGYCEGIAEGASQALQFNKIICRPKGITRKQTNTIIVRFAEDHPEFSRLDYVGVVVLALQKTWPCK
jgi:hypothetical protein